MEKPITTEEVRERLAAAAKSQAEVEALCDPKKRYIVIDTENFTNILVSLLQLSSRELRQILLRRVNEDTAQIAPDGKH